MLKEITERMLHYRAIWRHLAHGIDVHERARHGVDELRALRLFGAFLRRAHEAQRERLEPSEEVDPFVAHRFPRLRSCAT